jgi:hypothetical protein
MLPPPGAVPGAGVALPPGACPDGNCAGHGRSCLQRFKQWLCFQYSCSDLPKCQPTPYITPLQGMFPCTPCGCGGNVGAPPARPLPWPAGGAPAQPQPPVDPNAPPMPQPKPPGGQPLPQPLPLPTGAGVMPPRGTQGAAAAPAGAARATAAPVSVNPNAGRYRAPSWNSSAWKPTSAGPVVTASGTQK